MRVVARAIIVNNDRKVLIAKRAQRWNHGRWTLPGGKSDEGEAPEVTIVREVGEELSIPFTPRLFKETWEREPEGGREPWNVFIFAGPLEGTPTQKPDEISELMFVGRDDLDGLDFAFGHKDILIEFFDSQK